MASEQNKRLLAQIGIEGEGIRAAGPGDLVVAVVAESQEIADRVLASLDEALTTVQAATPTSDLHTLEDGLQAKPSANLAQLTIPGAYVPQEARKALLAGLNLFIFSSNVPVEDERALKQLASERGLLVMGPDCGTSIVNGAGLGFANAVRRGPIGVVGPAGTGLQEFTCRIHQAGQGISHAIGTGGRDLLDDIGGLTTWAALDRLEADHRTEVIAVVAKPAGENTRRQLIVRLEASRKPAVACLLGSTAPETQGRVKWAGTIDAAADAAVGMSSGGGRRATEAARSPLGSVRSAWTPTQRFVRGVFAGGTLCYQSQQVFRDSGMAVLSNTPLDHGNALGPFDASRGHTMVDMGDEVFTLGRLHPMIDGSLRRQRILRIRRPSVAVLLLDFILGYNASPDPVGDVLESILEGRKARANDAGPLAVVASVCGTEQDPQGLDRQMELLRQAGVEVFSSSAAAASFCADLVRGR
jgi:succinyl-CoA synthetase alpha subunit